MKLYNILYVALLAIPCFAQSSAEGNRSFAGDFTCSPTIGSLNCTVASIGGKTVSLSGNLTTTGAFNATLAIPSSSTWTFPSGGGTLAISTIVNATSYGCIADNSTDNITCINNALAAITSAGGGTLYFPPAASAYFTTPFTLPNTGGGTTFGTQVPIRLTGISGFLAPSGLSVTNPASGSGSVIRFGSTSNAGKITTLGSGKCEIDHLTFTDSDTTSTIPFLYLTNTTCHIHDNTFLGASRAGPTTNIEDAIVLGGDVVDGTITGTSASAFQGYGTIVDNNFFDYVCRAVWLRSSANGIQIANNTIWSDSGCSGAANGAIELSNNHVAAMEGNYITGNLFEMTGYAYGIYVKTGVSKSNQFVANSFFDQGSTTVACIDFEPGINGNIVSGIANVLSSKPDVKQFHAYDNVVLSGTLTSSTMQFGANVNFLSAVTFQQSPTFMTDVIIGSGSQFITTGRSHWYANADGVWTAWNNAQTGFTRINLGGTTTTVGAIGVTNQTNPIILIRDAAGGNTASLDGGVYANVTTGYRIGNSATTGHVLRGNGTNYVDSQLAYSDLSGTPTSGSGASYQLNFQPGLMTSILGSTGVYGKIVNASTVDNLIGSAISFTCAVNPTVTMFECGTSSTCASPTTIGTVTITAAGQAFTGTVSSAAVTAGDFIGWSVSAGTCTSLDLSATAQIHSN